MIKHTRIAAILATAAVSIALGAVTAPTAAADTYCGTSSRGASVYAGNNRTSCAFALSTAEAYHSYGKGSQPFTVTSPTTGDTYTMTCIHAGSECSGGNDALVYLRP